MKTSNSWCCSGSLTDDGQHHGCPVQQSVAAASLQVDWHPVVLLQTQTHKAWQQFSPNAHLKTDRPPKTTKCSGEISFHFTNLLSLPKTHHRRTSAPLLLGRQPIRVTRVVILTLLIGWRIHLCFSGSQTTLDLHLIGCNVANWPTARETWQLSNTPQPRRTSYSPTTINLSHSSLTQIIHFCYMFLSMFIK